jgi:hypothetical protein
MDTYTGTLLIYKSTMAKSRVVQERACVVLGDFDHARSFVSFWNDLADGDIFYEVVEVVHIVDQPIKNLRIYFSTQESPLNMV